MRFDTSGFFTEEQMVANTKIIHDSIHARVERAQLFVTDNEWKQIHQFIASAGCYTDPRFKKATAGDSALMIAVRLRSFKAARYLLHSGVDAAMRNEKDETVAEVIESKFKEIIEERNQIRILRVQAKSLRQTSLSEADHLVLASEPQTMGQIEASYDLCNELSKLFEVRLVNISLLKIKRKLAEVEGSSLAERELYELGAEQTMVASKKLVEKLAESVVSIVAEWDGSKVAEQLRKKKIDLDKSSKKKDRVDHWRNELSKSAVLIQAAWRGCTVRNLLELLTLHRACVYVQSRTRGFLARASLREAEINLLTTMMQTVGRGFLGRKKAAKKARRVYPSPELVENLVAANKAAAGIAVDELGPESLDENGHTMHTPAFEFVATVFEGELDKPKLVNATSQPKGQWAMLRYMAQRKALEGAKKTCLDDRKNGDVIGKLAALCLEHGLADSNFTDEGTRRAFTKIAAALFERAEKSKHSEHGLFCRRRGDAMLRAFTMHGVQLEHEYLHHAVDAYEKALKFIEVALSPDCWLDKATAQCFTGNFGAAIKTVDSMVREFPNFQKMSEVSMLAASLHLNRNEFAKAAAFVHHASVKGGGASYYAQMDLVMVAGRINEKWYEFLEQKSQSGRGSSSARNDDDDDDEEEEKEEGEEEEEKKEAKWLASEKAYLTVFRHYLAHKNVFHKKKYESWIAHPATWVRTATRAAKSGHYSIAEDFYNQALDRCGWWMRYKKRGEVEEVEEESEVLSSDDRNEQKEEPDAGGDSDDDDDDESESYVSEVEKGDVHHEHEIHTHDLKQVAARILFELAKCRYYQGDLEGAREFLHMAKDEEVLTNTQGTLEGLKIANNAWGASSKHMNHLEKDAKMAFPTIIAAIPNL